MAELSDVLLQIGLGLGGVSTRPRRTVGQENARTVESVATLDVPAHGAGLCGGVVAVRVGAFEGPLRSVDPHVPAKVAEVPPLVGTARELADRGGLASVLPVVTGDGAGIGTRVVALPHLYGRSKVWLLRT